MRSLIVFPGRLVRENFCFIFFYLEWSERMERLRRIILIIESLIYLGVYYLLLFVLSYFEYELAENTFWRAQCDLLRRVIARVLEIAHCARSTNPWDILLYYNERAIYRMQSWNRYWKSYQTFAKLYLTSQRKI